MEKYHNPQPPEGINTSPAHPILTFIKLLAGMIVVLVAVAWILGKSGSWLATLVPFSQEVQISEAYSETELDTGIHPGLRKYLDHLTARITPGLHLPEGMKIKIHYQPEDVENAFATLGGNILLYKGLLKALPNENSLMMLIAHESAHVKLRHPIRSAGQNLAVSAGIKLLMGFSDIDILGETGLYTQLHFSREMETAADTEGLTAVHAAYGHVSGATDLFKTLHKISTEHGIDAEPAFFSTHPLDESRIEALNQLARDQGWVNDKSQITPLPDKFMEWLEYVAPETDAGQSDSSEGTVQPE